MFKRVSIGLIGFSTAACAAEATVSPVWDPVAAGETYDGKSLGDWAVEWRRWAYAQTDCEKDTRYDATGELCGMYQPDGAPVFFLDRGPASTNRDQCRVPRGKAIIVPIAMYSIDNAGAAEQLTEEELLDAATTAGLSARDMVLEADGRSIDNLHKHKFGPLEMSYYIPAAPNWYTCHMKPGVADVTVEPVFLSGALAVFPPPSQGTHTLRYGGTVTSRAGDALRSEVTSVFHVD